MKNPKEPTHTLVESLTWVECPDCTCEHKWKSYGRLYGISMGFGWVRMKTDPDCPHHSPD